MGYGAVSHLENILTEQIELFAFETIEHNKAVAPLIETIRVYLEAKMRHCLAENMGDKAHLELLIYGSQLTGLAVRLSDVDMLVRSSVPACDLMELF